MLLFTVITTVGYLLSMKREDTLSKYRIRFVVGGVLFFIGKELQPRRVKPVGRGLYTVLIAVALLGIAFFYAVFLPTIVNMIRSFIEFISGRAASPPQPTLVPVPLLFQYEELIAYLVTAIAIGVVVHEASHAIVALREGVKVRSWGIGMVFLFPLAFVELDEDQFSRASPRTRISIATAGVFSNAIVSLISLTTLLIISAVLPHIGGASTAVMISRVDCSVCDASPCPAQLIGLSAGNIIAAVDGARVYSVREIELLLRNKSIGSQLTIMVCSSSGCRDTIVLLNARNARIYREEGLEVPCLGVSMTQVLVFERDGVILHYPAVENLLTHLNFIFIVNFSLYVLNSIPFIVSDGSIFVAALSSIFHPLKALTSRKLIDIINIAILVIAIAVSSYIFLGFT